MFTRASTVRVKNRIAKYSDTDLLASYSQAKKQIRNQHAHDSVRGNSAQLLQMLKAELNRRKLI